MELFSNLILTLKHSVFSTKSEYLCTRKTNRAKKNMAKPKRKASMVSRGTQTKRQRTSAPYVRPRRRGTKPTTMSKFVKNIALKLSESKRVDVVGQFTTGSLAHDGIYEYLLNTTDQGNTTVPTRIVNSAVSNGRVSDEVYSTGFMIRGCFGLPFDRRNTCIKIWLVDYNTNQGTPTNQAHWYRDTTGNSMLDPLNDDRFPGVKLLRVLRHKARDLYVERGELTDNGSIAQLYYKIWIPYRRKLRYASGSQLPPIAGCKERLSLICTAYDTASALTTDVVVVDHRQSVTWYYKDP